MIETIWSLLIRFTTEAHQAALEKCKELNLNQKMNGVSIAIIFEQ